MLLCLGLEFWWQYLLHQEQRCAIVILATRTTKSTSYCLFLGLEFQWCFMPCQGVKLSSDLVLSETSVTSHKAFLLLWLSCHQAFQRTSFYSFFQISRLTFWMLGCTFSARSCILCLLCEPVWHWPVEGALWEVLVVRAARSAKCLTPSGPALLLIPQLQRFC